MTSFPDLLLDHDGPLCVVTLHRPKVLNALNASVISQLGQALTQIAGRADVRAVLLTGAGDRAFVAGADIAAMAALSPTEAQEFSRQGHELGSIMATLPQPIIAVINGFALGGGLELALACDMLLASKTACSFSMTSEIVWAPRPPCRKKVRWPGTPTVPMVR